MKNKQPDPRHEEDTFEAIRNLLLGQEQERLENLEEKIRGMDLREDQLTELLDELRRQHEDTEALIERIAPAMPGLVGRTIRNSGDEMSEILSPIMGGAIRAQIRDSRDEMADALYPVIGAAIQKAIGQFSRDLQRNIDMRLQSAFGAEGTLRRLVARLRGISGSELAMRGAFSYQIKEIFLIHRSSGILIAHSHPDDFQTNDSDLIGSMLTAIRSFATDVFHGNNELDEIQFGEDHIIIQNGAQAYIAMVISGIEPDGLRSHLSEFTSNLHLRYNNTLRDFKGDPKDLPNFQPQLAQLMETLDDREGKKPASPQQKRTYVLVAITTVILFAFFCFYLFFTIKLLPIAFPAPTSTVTATTTSTLTPTPLPTLTSTLSPTSTPLPTLTPVREIRGFTTGSVWTHTEPLEDSERVNVILENTTVKIHSMYGNWLNVSWTDDSGTHNGWVIAKWIQPEQAIPEQITTPVP